MQGRTSKRRQDRQLHTRQSLAWGARLRHLHTLSAAAAQWPKLMAPAAQWQGLLAVAHLLGGYLASVPEPLDVPDVGAALASYSVQGGC
eukprot:1153724-Pelagomonas_calceolata.AAC.2